MGDGSRPPIRIGGNPTGVLNRLTAHRTEHPIEGEIPRLTLVGWPRGHAEVAVRQLVVIGGVTAAGLIALLVAPMGVTLVVLVALLIAGALLLQRRASRDGRFSLVGLVLTDRRLVVVRDPGTGDAASSTEERPAASVTWATVEASSPATSTRRSPPVVVLGGPDGPLVELELPKVEVDGLRHLVAEAGIEIRGAPGDARSG